MIPTTDLASVELSSLIPPGPGKLLSVLYEKIFSVFQNARSDILSRENRTREDLLNTGNVQSSLYNKKAWALIPSILQAVPETTYAMLGISGTIAQSIAGIASKGTDTVLDGILGTTHIQKDLIQKDLNEFSENRTSWMQMLQKILDATETAFRASRLSG